MGCASSKDVNEPAAGTAADGKAQAATGAAADGSSRKPSEPLSPAKVEVTLDANQSTRVKELFTTRDIDASGKLELAAFIGAVTKVGPHQTKVLAQLQDMDADKDGFVTKEVTTPKSCPPPLHACARCCGPPARPEHLVPLRPAAHTHTACTHTPPAHTHRLQLHTAPCARGRRRSGSCGSPPPRAR